MVKLLDELGLLQKLRSQIIPFMSELYLRYNKENEGRLTFEEFKAFYNAAVQDAKGLRPQAQLRDLSPVKMNGQESPTKAKKRWALAKAEMSYLSYQGQTPGR